MFPSMGFGVFGLRAPEGPNLFPVSLARHFFFGAGLAAAWALAARLAPAQAP